MSADDGFVLQFGLRNGAVGVLQTTCADNGPLAILTRVAGSTGAAWIDGVGADVWVSDASGTRQVPVGADLSPASRRFGDLSAPRYEPLPGGLLETDYDRMIAHGLDLPPYTRLAEHFRARICGEDPPPGPAPATFEDGVAGMEVLDAIRRSVVTRRREPVAAP
jgi:predicted dehydrogenase